MKTKQCRILHLWKRVPVCSVHTYQECTRCGTRRVLEAPLSAGYEPVDGHWLQTGFWLQSSPTYGLAFNGASQEPVALNIVFSMPANRSHAKPQPANTPLSPGFLPQTAR